MSHDAIIKVNEAIAKDALVDKDKAAAMRAEAEKDPETFWAGVAARLDWSKPFTKVKDVSFDASDLHIRWFYDGELNACVNCLDRHLPEKANDVAIIWESDDPGVDKKITYAEAFEETCRMANVLKARGVKKGDRVVIYMPMIPEAAYAMLACARIGAVHSVVFGGFSPDALASRIEDCGASAVITADEGVRGGKTVPLKANVDKALEKAPDVRAVLVVERTRADIPMKAGRDLYWYAEARDDVSPECPAEAVNAEDTLFILYTSGSTGKPKGVLHTTGGYLAYAAYTYEMVFDYKPGEIYWCTADVGWVTGHSYIVYGPLANGATTLIFEGVPTYPDASRFWRVIEKHKVNIFYTAPTALRALMREGDDWVKKADRSSLRLLGSVGEPINPEAWMWYYEVVGDSKHPIVDTWWQTETGGILISPLPGATDLKPGSATQPLPGVFPAIVDANGNFLEGACEGNLVITDSWPGQMRTVYGDHQRFIDTYFKTYPGMYFTGDGVRRDADGYYWITGRVDDVINVSGHRMGTAEVEAAIDEHPLVVESAVVGFPHDVKGQGIYAYVTLHATDEPSEALEKEIVETVRQEIGPIAKPDHIHFTPGLPKTRSGKIMRRILRKIAENEFGALGDTSTLADPGVVDALIEGRKNR
ncbi:acetate--CoA ligase [Hyphococcus luteus]|uniref:Acetyl-coenzyme A synthetase n=1 Tax=Hyphococcus luteus TaxID=2058213 RepID=A0A2S7JZM2_9PROT|nr:acetate--CoA ligase [Marinicaulis flavus]PQA85704.1 acetate--CoA ligase [Marinicaulis flavus]